MTSWPALLSGLLFGMGLSLSGMTDPAKVKGFLDITGAWVPDLAFVMGGALMITLMMTSAILRRGTPLLASAFNVPNRNTIDRRLIIGSAIFGIGWGLSGFCPGPALLSLIYGYTTTFIFCIAMIAGMFGATLFNPRPHP
ncbi:YeeE/YedE family protein [Luminiphilus sp.]|nr:YeeE/YedE family protein [Luminiphilus sp.]